MRALQASTPRRRPTDFEGIEQQAYFHWLRCVHPEAWLHTFHPPNGGKRNKITAAILKAQGAKAGVPDIFMDYPRGAYHGLRIELKATPPHDAAVADSQKEWQIRLSTAGYCAVICKGLDAARNITDLYLALGVFDGSSRLGAD